MLIHFSYSRRQEYSFCLYLSSNDNCVFLSCLCFPVMSVLSCHACAFLSCLCFPVMPVFSCHACVFLSCLCFLVMSVFSCHVCVFLSCLRRQASRKFLFFFTSTKLKAYHLIYSLSILLLIPRKHKLIMIRTQ